MRITPTHEQMAYLASIGVSRTTFTRPESIAIGYEQCGKAIKHRKSAGRSAKWWAIVPAFLFLLFFMVVLARANEIHAVPAQGSAPPVAKEAHQPTNPVLDNRLPAVEKEPAWLPLPAKEAVSFRENLTALERQIISLRSLLKTDFAHDQGGQIKPSSQKDLPPDLEMLRQKLEKQREDLQLAIILGVVIITLGAPLVTIGGIRMRMSIRQIQQNLVSQLSERSEAPALSRGTQPANMDGGDITKNPPMDKKRKVEPTRPQPIRLPSPAEQVRIIIDSESKFNRFRVKPRVSTDPWRLGLATAKGNVRLENQDYGLCFQIDGHEVLVVADGLGGIPHGQRAAYLAVVSAAVSIIRTFGRSPRWHAPCLKSAALKAITDAGHRLAVEGDKLNISAIRGGLRTTLIVVVANKREIGYAYIGDGGGCVVHSSGEVHHFLKPQKANEFAMNILAASLGPMTEGEPVAGFLKRSTGDVLIVGTDGIFDRVDKGFPKDVIRGCVQFDGDLQKTAEHIVQELASFQDSAGYICDDNLTLGVMGDGEPPSQGPGFCLPLQATEERLVQAQPAEGAPCLKEKV